MDAEIRRMFDAFDATHLGDPSVINIVRSELERAVANGWQPDGPGERLLADLGAYLVRILDIVALLADAVVNGEHVPGYVRQIATELVNEPDMRTTDYLDEKHTALAYVCHYIYRPHPPLTDCFDRN